MAATRIRVVKLHVTQDGLFQEFLWYHVFKHLFLEITHCPPPRHHYCRSSSPRDISLDSQQYTNDNARYQK